MDAYIAAIILGLCLSSMGLGIFLSMKVFNIPDITTDGSYTLGAALTAVLLTQNISLFFIVPIILLSGAIAGVCTAFIHTKFKIEPLLSGILVMTALYSINLSIMGRSNIPLINTANIFSLIHFLNNANTSSFIIVFILILSIAFLLNFILKTDFGIAMRATGNNNLMVRNFGVNDEKIKIYGLAMANALTAFAGFLITQFQYYADINMGIGIVITGLGSVLIGDAFKTFFKTESIALQIALVIIGSIIFQLILAFALSIGVAPYLLKLITSVFVLLIVILPKLKKQS